MSNVMTLAMQITAVDMLSSVVARIKQHVLSLGPAAGKVKNDFDDMTRHMTAGLKAVAVSSYALSKMKGGVNAASSIQESMINVKLNLMEAGKSAHDLDAELASVRRTAVDVSKIAPFSAQEVIDIENTFLKAGLGLKDVTAKGGAAWAATALATISNTAPDVVGDAMVTMAVPFNVKGGQFRDLADWVQRVDMASVTTVPELMEGMKYVAGTASMMKVSWQDTLRAMGVISQSGLRGSMGGTSLNDFLLRMTGTARESRRVMAELNQILSQRGGGKVEFFDKAGKFRGLPVIIDNLRTAMSKFNDRDKLFIMEKIFGEQGGRAAAALIKEGAGSWEAVGGSIKNAAALEEKMRERLEGFNASLKALGGTAKTTLGTLFDPILAPAATTLKILNDIVGKIGQIGDAHPMLPKVVSHGGLAVAGAAGGYGLYRLLRGVGAGGRVLKGLGGFSGLLGKLGGTAAGVAKGKAVEAATGVTPVFVTNWPAMMGMGSTIPVPGGIGGKIKDFAKWIPWTAIGAGSLAVGAGGTALAGGGTAIYALIDVLRGGSGDNWINQGAEKLAKIIHETFRQDSDKPNAGYEFHNNVPIYLNIDDNLRVTAKTNDMKTNIDLKRGKF